MRNNTGSRLAQNVRLRSANRGNANNTWNVNSSGNVNNNNASNSNRFAPIVLSRGHKADAQRRSSSEKMQYKEPAVPAVIGKTPPQ